MGLIVRK